MWEELMVLILFWNFVFDKNNNEIWVLLQLKLKDVELSHAYRSHLGYYNYYYINKK